MQRLIRRPKVEGDTGLPCSTIYEMMAEGTFPQCIPLHGRTVAWVESQVQQWIADRIEEAKQLQAEAEEEDQDKVPEQQEEDEEAEVEKA